MQDLFVAIVKASRRFDPERGQFLTWATTIAICRLADLQRRIARERKRLQAISQAGCRDGEAFEQLLEAATCHTDPPRHHGREDELMRELAKLPHRSRYAIRRRFFDGVEDAVIATELGCSAAAIRGLVSRALGHLFHGLGPDPPGPQSGSTPP